MALMLTPAIAEAAPTQDGPDIPEPMVFDMIRPLTAKRGEVEVNGVRLSAGDGAAVSRERSLKIRGVSKADALLFDLA